VSQWLLSPAKVNLHLQVLEKRGDGYHEIQTLMQRIALFDEIEIQPGGPGIRLIAEGEAIPVGPDNLLIRAAQSFCESGKIGEGMEIRVRKRIPVAAGLGGGSSNAGTLLRGLNDQFRTGWDLERLMFEGAKLGADVPFFIFQKPALARGIGEKLRPVRLPENLWYCLVIPPFQIATVWAYAAYDQTERADKSPMAIPDTYAGIEDLPRVLINDLELPAFSRYPQIGAMKEKLNALGAKGALMSGSGPVIFGLFSSQEEGQAAEKALQLPKGWRSMVIQGLGSG
jgi:4-diphosphocytidyl-2-C-methyl-D-erythritol kinase